MSSSLPSQKLADWAPTVVRVGVGSAMIVNGAGKLLNIGPRAVGLEAFAGYLASLGLPFPTALSWAAALAEGLGGLLLVLGLFTRFAAAFIVITMVVAALLVHVPAGFPVRSIGSAYTIGEYTWVLIATSFSLILSGPGRYSLERSLLGREWLPAGRSPGEPLPSEESAK